ncbi:MAG: hypothetical protein CVU56_11170 [Deltaproteobacteria bacterium HGW-Deltaproteobacteria-14]|nr:MAG: hypothetical protein CVU56_11170 [Deltaproteobacteria bacterium HGW-Deltaproteobacteria-14]
MCGLNGEGVLQQACSSGHWVDDWSQCSGQDVCVNGTDGTEPCGATAGRSRGCVDGAWGAWGECLAPRPASSVSFAEYARYDLVPGRYPDSACADHHSHDVCVSMGCAWLRTIGSGGVCREDPVARCLTSGECECAASDFHGDASYDGDLLVFVPLSVSRDNLAPSHSQDYTTTVFTGGGACGNVTYEGCCEANQIKYCDAGTFRSGTCAGTCGWNGEYYDCDNTGAEPSGAHPIACPSPETLDGFTSRTDFSHKSLDVYAQTDLGASQLTQAQGLTLTLKFMHTWADSPTPIQGVLFDGLGMRVEASGDHLSLRVGDVSYPLTGEGPAGKVKNYQCNQLAVVLSSGPAKVYLGGAETTIAGLTIDVAKSQLAATSDDNVLSVGQANAKMWDLRLYGNDRVLTHDEVAELGKRCGDAGQYAIPSGYPESNARYAWGMGGYNITPDSASRNFASGVYVTLWIPSEDTWPPTDPTYIADLHRMIGFWDRWHEQMFFELDFIPFVDTRSLEPAGSINPSRDYSAASGLCPGGAGSDCGEPKNYNNPCRYVTDLFQGFNWLPEDFPGEDTSADHRKIAEAGGWTQLTTFDSDVYDTWNRPVHEHAHTLHYTLMRTYEKTAHYIRGIAGESFAEAMMFYVFAGLKTWLTTGLTYYPTVPLAFEGKWNGQAHVFQSSQPYQERNIGDQGLGARFYGMGTWWTFVNQFASKPYLLGRIATDTDQTPGTTLQKTRFYLAQEGLDLGELFGNYAAHVATWDWPLVGHRYYAQEQQPFQGIGVWCTTNTGASCSVDRLKVQADVSPVSGTNGEWVDGPALTQPGGFAFDTVRVAAAPGGAWYEIGLEFEVPDVLYPDSGYDIALDEACKDDPRFFSSRIVVADVGSQGAPNRARPQYYKIPGRKVDSVFIEVPANRASNIYLLAVPTPPFELEDVPGFVAGHSLVWPFKYKVTRLAGLPTGATKLEPIVLSGQDMLSLTPYADNGFTYACFHDPTRPTPAALKAATDTLTACLDFCVTSGALNSGVDPSCNQQLSCRNACVMRFDGASVAECEGHCDRPPDAGCFLTLRGRDYALCDACVGDIGAGDLSAECVAGCAVE